MWTTLLLGWALTSPAVAQDEPCRTYGLARWRAELDVTQQTLDALKVDRARAMLDEIDRQLPCLDAVAEPSDVARHSRVAAQRALFDMDVAAFDGWVRLADELDPDGVWTQPSDHPLWRFLPRVADAEPIALPGRHPAHPKRGGIFLDGRFVDTLEATAETPHLLQVFDGGGRPSLTRWIVGPSFPDTLVTSTPVDAEPPRWWTGEVDEAVRYDASGWKAARIDTLDAYEEYLERHPTGEHAAEARRRIDDHLWAATGESPTPEDAAAYLARFPEGRHATEARAVIRGADLAEAVDAGTRSALRRFLLEHPRGLEATEARRRLDTLDWRDALQADTVEAYARYRLQWPSGLHAREARLAQEERARERVVSGDVRSVVITVEVPERPAWRAPLGAALVDIAGDRSLQARVVTPQPPSEDETPADALGLEPGEGLWRLVVTEHPEGSLVRLEGTLEQFVPGTDEPVETWRVVHPTFAEARTDEEVDVLGRYLAEALVR